ncbi:hypothetical protein BRADI_1g42280v3 [Brachypodium distachyon]|uniref:Ubiquitin-like protease family profile domain-containing protein n=1 Tax=Brachypodium distachyon TaxID=15368 RepID=A0A0Q3H670_BRADI|nr:hypothetical protein BRADI_1g42280v3 [Brachypodium distachyon]
MGADSPQPDDDSEVGISNELRNLSDQVLKERFERMEGRKVFTSRLPDGGKKFDLLLRAICRELARRQAARSVMTSPKPPPAPPPPRPHGCQSDRDKNRRGRINESSCAGSSGLPTGSNENHGVTKSDFIAAFEADDEAGIDVSGLETSTGPSKPKHSVENERNLYKLDEYCKTDEQPTYLSPKVLCVDNSTDIETMSPDDGCKDNGRSRMCELSTRSRKRKLSVFVFHAPMHASVMTSYAVVSRKRDLEVDFSMRLRSRKVPEVVLLDGDAHHSESSKNASIKWDAMKIYYPSSKHPGSVELSDDDIKCLEPESLLSSPIMNFYIMYLQGPMSSISTLRGKFHIFNTYFFSKLEALTSKDDKASYFLKLRRWWKGVDIFQKSYILLPVHADTHWSLVIICMPAKEDQSGPIILHLDSLKFHRSRLIFSVVERFLKEEWKYLNENCSLAECPIQEKVWKSLPRKIEKKPIEVPQQDNEYDCGLFVLYYMQRFIEEAPERLHKKELSMFGKTWFQPKEASALRKKMQTLLLQLFEEAKPNSNTLEHAAPQSAVEAKPENNVVEATMSERPLEGSSAEMTSPYPLEGTSTQPTSFEHPLECS